MILRRLVTAGWSAFEIVVSLRMTPSMRARTTTCFACGSKWRSDACSSIAREMRELTRLIAGALVAAPPRMSSSAVESSSSSSSAIPMSSEVR